MSRQTLDGVTVGEMYWRGVIEDAAIEACRSHFEERHVNQIPPCAEAQIDAEWWAVAFGIAKEAAS